MNQSDEMSYELYRNHLEDGTLINDTASESEISVLTAIYQNGTSYYMIKNKFNILQQICISYVIDDDCSSVNCNEVSIFGVHGNIIDTPFNLYDDRPFILFSDLLLYIEWFSQIEDILPLLPTTPPP